jgi:hypothetical protein
MTKEDLRDCFAMFASIRMCMGGSKETMATSADRCYQFADAMLEARKPKEKENEEDIGIAAVVPKRTRKR